MDIFRIVVTLLQHKLVVYGHNTVEYQQATILGVASGNEQERSVGSF